MRQSAWRDATPATTNKITTNDRRFLESLHIQVDQEIMNEDREEPKFEMIAAGYAVFEVAENYA